MRCSLPANGQLLQSMHEGSVLELHFLVGHGELELREALEQCAENDLELEPGEGLAQTLVDAEREGHMVHSVRTAHVEFVRIGKHLRITVGRAEQCIDSLSGSDLLSPDFDIG